MLNFPLNSLVRHVDGGPIATVVGHVLTGGRWLHLLEINGARMWVGPAVLVAV